MSKPAAHAPIAAPRSHGSTAAMGPPAASHPPTGATAMASARNNCVYVVNRLASEYQNTMASASGDSTKHTRPSAYAAPTNATEAAATKTIASQRVIAPRGSSRIAVRGLFASYRASTSRLKPIAAPRAATIATTIQTTRHATSRPDKGRSWRASSDPVQAKGSAKTLWLNLTNDK